MRMVVTQGMALALAGALAGLAAAFLAAREPQLALRGEA
jgi:hypothetical protein